MPTKQVNNAAEKNGDGLHHAEMKHQNEAMQICSIVKDEAVRRGKVQSTVLRGELSSLRDQVVQQNERHEKLSRQHSDVRIQLAAATRKTADMDKKLKAQARESANLKAELQSLNGISQDSAKLLAEKLALRRELDNLKPELEHLRSQLAHRKDVLAEKLALERQLNALEVELSTERRAAQRAVHRQETKGSEVEEDLRRQILDLERKLAAEKQAVQRASKESERSGVQLENDLRQQVVELEKQIASERSEWSKARRESERSRVEAEGRIEFLTDRLSSMKAKLRETRQELKDCRTSLAEAQSSATSHAAEAVAAAKAAKSRTIKPQASRKRRTNEMDVDDNVLHTPTNDDARPRRPLKKRGLEALAAEKSHFSITPFLTKTISFADTSVEFTAGGGAPGGGLGHAANPDVHMETDETNRDTTRAFPTTFLTESNPAFAKKVERQAASLTSATKDMPKPGGEAAVALKALKEAKPRGRLKATCKAVAPLGDSPSAKQNANMSLASSGKASRSESTLEKVMEEVDEESREGQENGQPEPMSANVPAKLQTGAGGASNPEPKNKKRKLLGGGGGAVKTSAIFGDGEDDAETVAPVPAATKRQPVVKVQLGGGATSRVLGKIQKMGAGPGAAFAGKPYSPLMRHRRGVNASFLS